MYVGGDPVNWNDPEGLVACPADTPNSVFVCSNGQPQAMTFVAAMSAMILFNPPTIGSPGPGVLTQALQSMRQLAKAQSRAAQEMYQRCRREAEAMVNVTPPPNLFPEWKEGGWSIAILLAAKEAAQAFAKGLGPAGALAAFVESLALSIGGDHAARFIDYYKQYITDLGNLLAQCERRLREAATVWQYIWANKPVGNFWEQ